MSKRRKPAPMIPPAKPKKPVVKRIPITKRTQELLVAKDIAFRNAQMAAEVALQAFNDTVNPILSEHGIDRAIAKEVTPKPPYELVVEVVARTKGG